MWSCDCTGVKCRMMAEVMLVVIVCIGNILIFTSEDSFDINLIMRMCSESM